MQQPGKLICVWYSGYAASRRRAIEKKSSCSTISFNLIFKRYGYILKAKLTLVNILHLHYILGRELINATCSHHRV